MEQLSELFLKSGAILSLDADRVVVGWGDFRASAKEPDSGISFYAPDFFLEDPAPWKIPSHVRVVSRQELARFLETLPSFEFSRPRWQGPSDDRFFASFAGLRCLIDQGHLKKGVPVVFERACDDVGRGRLVGFLLQLLSRPQGRIYGFWTSLGSTDAEGILGLTPEDLFVKSSDGSMRTMAVAGTYPVEAGGEALLKDPKERVEHQWVIDGIRSALSPLGRVYIGSTRVDALPTLLHLKTEIDVAPYAAVSFMEWVDALHPTAALGAFPRDAGAGWLRMEDQGIGRHRFGAPFGVSFAQGEAFCVVAIRNIQWSGGEIRIGSGCGVVRESHPEREWKELSLKREAVKRSLGW